MDAEGSTAPSSERTLFEMEEPPPKTHPPRFKPNRVCVILVVVSFTLMIIIFHHLHHSSHAIRESLSHPRMGGQVSILMDERSPYNITITSDLDILQSFDSGGSKVEIFVRELLENRSSGPLRITRSNGDEYDVRLSYDQRPPRQPKLTRLDEIKPNVLNIFFIETRCGTIEQTKKHSSYSGVRSDLYVRDS